MSQQQLERDVRFLKRYAVVSTASLVVGVLAAFKQSGQQTAEQGEVHRDRRRAHQRRRAGREVSHRDLEPAAVDRADLQGKAVRVRGRRLAPA